MERDVPLIFLGEGTHGAPIGISLAYDQKKEKKKSQITLENFREKTPLYFPVRNLATSNHQSGRPVIAVFCNGRVCAHREGWKKPWRAAEAPRHPHGSEKIRGIAKFRRRV